MKASVRIANVYDNILEETTKKLVVVKDRKTYIGALFFKKDKEEEVKKVHDRTEVDGTALDIVLAAYDLLKNQQEGAESPVLAHRRGAKRAEEQSEHRKQNAAW